MSSWSVAKELLRRTQGTGKSLEPDCRLPTRLLVVFVSKFKESIDKN
jgi:hypothetical protein